MAYDAREHERLDDDTGLKKTHEAPLARKVTKSGSYIYIAVAKPGTTQATAKWQVQRIDKSDPENWLTTWADGDTEFDNVATDLTSLSYE